jgi:hypothetical protein
MDGVSGPHLSAAETIRRAREELGVCAPLVPSGQVLRGPARRVRLYTGEALCRTRTGDPFLTMASKGCG